MCHTGNKGAFVHMYFRNDIGVRLLEHGHFLEILR